MNFSPDGKHLATASADTTARVWDWASGREVSRMIHQQRVNSVTYSPAGDLVATAGDDYVAQIWNVSRGTVSNELETGQKDLKFVISPGADLLARASKDGDIRVRNINSGKETSINFPKTDFVFFSSNGKYVGAISDILDDNAALQWWNANNGVPLTPREPLNADPLIAISPTDKFWVRAVIGNDGSDIITYRIIEKATGREMRLKGKDFEAVNISPLEFVSFSANEKYLVAADDQESHTIKVLDLETGRELPLPENFNVSAMALTPLGDYLALASENKIHVRQMSTWSEVAVLQNHAGKINRLLFNSNGSMLASGSADNTSCVWTKSGADGTFRLVATFTHEGPVVSIAFSHDRKYLATASSDNTTRVWDIARGTEVARQTTDDAIQVAFVSNDKYLAIAHSASEELSPPTATAAQLWLWSPATLLSEACARLVPNLTADDWQQYEKWHQEKMGGPPLKTCENLITTPAVKP